MPKKRTVKPVAKPGALAELDSTGLPPVPAAAVDTVTEFLITRWELKRPPIVAAALMVLLVALERQQQPFPERARVARHLGCSIYGIDAALSVALARGLITQEVSTEAGNVRMRDSIVRRRFYVPNDELRGLVKHAARRAA